MKYSLEIIQSEDGEESVVAVDAEGAIEDGVLTLSYAFDGAEYLLEISEREMRQRRSGNLSLSMLFRMGEKTKCSLSDGVNGGSFDIFTEEYQADFNGLNCVVNCLFSDGAGGAGTRIKAAARCLE